MVAEVSALIGDLDAHHPQVEAGGKRGMADGGGHVLAQVAAHPFDAVALDDVVGVEDVLDAGNGGHVPAHDDGGVRREFPDHAAHLARLADIHDDGRDAHDVVMVGRQLAGEGLARGEIEDRARSGDILLNHEDAPGAMKPPHGEGSLRFGHLVVVELHRIDGAAAEFVVLRVWAEHGRKQDTSLDALGMRILHFLEAGRKKKRCLKVSLAGLRPYYDCLLTASRAWRRLSRRWPCTDGIPSACWPECRRAAGSDAVRLIGPLAPRRAAHRPNAAS